MVKPLHILHSVISLDTGGLERVVLDLVRAGVRRGDRIGVLCLEREGALANEARGAGAEVRCLEKPPGRDKRVRVVAANLISKLRPSVVHTHQIGPAWYVSKAARAMGIPVVHTEHGDPFARAHRMRDKIKQRLLYFQTARWLSRFCCVSASVARMMKQFHTVPSDIIEVIINGVNAAVSVGDAARMELRDRYSIPHSAYVVGTVARLNEVKRLDMLLDAFSNVSKQHTDCYLIIVGDGPERSKLEDLARASDLTERVRFVGFQPEPEAFYRAMDVFALTSRSEGTPVSLLEAWSAGLPVVCTAVGGIADLVTNSLNGRLVKSGDVVAFSRALSWCVAHPELAMKLGARGRSLVNESYSLERMAECYADCYNRVLAVATAGEA